jgi:hypothetical protein
MRNVMEELRNVIDAIVETFPYALAAAAIVAGVIYSCVRLFHLRHKVRNLHSWKTDFRPARIAAVLTFICVLLPLSLLDYFFLEHAVPVMSPKSLLQTIVTS